MNSQEAVRRIDAVSLVFGLIFLGLAVLWLVSQVVTLNMVTVGWIVVAGLLGLGTAGVVGTVVRSVRHADDLDG